MTQYSPPQNIGNMVPLCCLGERAHFGSSYHWPRKPRFGPSQRLDLRVCYVLEERRGGHSTAGLNVVCLPLSMALPDWERFPQIP